jgi:hypothetical protein
LTTQYCNGSGTCNRVVNTSCNGFPCSGSSCYTTCTAMSTTGCIDGYSCGPGGNTCTQATVPCGLDGNTKCPIASKGGCNYTDSVVVCDTNWGGTASDPSFIPCNSKAECPTGTSCCIKGNNMCSNGGWDMKCTSDPSMCAGGGYSFGYYICDPAYGSADCPSGTTCQVLSSCIHGLYACL